MLSIQTIQSDTLELLKRLAQMFIDTPWNEMKKTIVHAVKAYQQ